jgi:hypothetical protein
MMPAFVHQTGLKTERKWKNYYRNASNPDEEPGRPIKEEAKVLQHSNAANQETDKKGKCEQTLII